MYITGKSQRFPMKASNLRVNNNLPGAPSPPNQPGSSLVINLGDRTESNFGNMINNMPGPDIDMLIGVSDIQTGAYKIQNTGVNLGQLPLFPQNNNTGSLSYRSSDYRSASPGPHVQATGTQAAESQLQTPMVIDTTDFEKQRISAALDSGGMQIQSLSPSATHKANLAGKQSTRLSQPGSMLLPNITEQ